MEGWRRLHQRTAWFSSASLSMRVWPVKDFSMRRGTPGLPSSPRFSAPVRIQSPRSGAGSGFVSALLFCVDSSLLPLNLSRLGVREIVRQDPFPSRKAPIVDYHLSLFPGLFFSEEDRRPGISRGKSGLTVPPHAVLLHPGSGDARKNWPLSRFLGLAELLQSSGLRVQWVAGPRKKTWRCPSELACGGALPWRIWPRLSGGVCCMWETIQGSHTLPHPPVAPPLPCSARATPRCGRRGERACRLLQRRTGGLSLFQWRRFFQRVRDCCEN